MNALRVCDYARTHSDCSCQGWPCCQHASILAAQEVEEEDQGGDYDSSEEDDDAFVEVDRCAASIPKQSSCKHAPCKMQLGWCRLSGQGSDAEDAAAGSGGDSPSASASSDGLARALTPPPLSQDTATWQCTDGEEAPAQAEDKVDSLAWYMTRRHEPVWEAGGERCDISPQQMSFCIPAAPAQRPHPAQAFHAVCPFLPSVYFHVACGKANLEMPAGCVQDVDQFMNMQKRLMPGGQTPGGNSFPASLYIMKGLLGVKTADQYETQLCAGC